MKVGIIGLGLIGGSLAKVLTLQGHTVYGADTAAGILDKAVLWGAVEGQLDESTAATLDVLIAAVNPSAVGAVIEPFLPHLKDGAIVSDIAGNKRGVAASMANMKARFPSLNFIAAHPMAGKETWGLASATATLFKNASLLIMPVAAELEAMAEFKSLMADAGFKTFKFTTPAEHDRMIAFTSQLPHVLSSAYVSSPLSRLHDGFSAGSFMDLTRVAKANADMWTALFLENRDNLLPIIQTFKQNLDAFYNAIDAGDAATLHALIENGNREKEEIDKASRKWRSENAVERQ